MRLVPEMDLGFLEPAGPFDKTAFVRVDQDIRDGRILQQWLDRPVARHFVDDLAREEVQLLLVERQAFGARIISYIGADLPGDLVGRKLLEGGEVELVNDSLVQLELDLYQSRATRNRLGIQVVRANRRSCVLSDCRNAFLWRACGFAGEKAHLSVSASLRGRHHDPCAG